MLYPGKIKKKYKKIISHKNRGLDLEYLINITNNYYLEKNIAVIYKKPTPITVHKVDYKQNKVTEGYYKTPSTLDYNGIYKGKYIDFDAKETINKTSFPLSNIHAHQIKHIEVTKADPPLANTEKTGYVIDGIWDGKVEIKNYLGASDDYNYYVYIVNLKNGKIDYDYSYGNMCQIGKGARYDENGKFLWDAFLDMKIQYKNGIYGMWSFGYGDSNPF